MAENYLDERGRIFDIQRYSIHDGSGIRTIVFLKGCVLRCKWCCNPESQEYKIQTMTVQGKEKTVGQDITALLRGAKEHGLTTAMESMACAEWSVIEKILPYLDTYLMDIKHTDPEKHRRFTGRSNELMLENAKKVAASGLTELIVRVPVVPTFNCTQPEIESIARFAASLPGVKKMHLLPYHRLGQDKYDGLGRKYELADILPPDNETMDRLAAAARRVSGLDVQIGG